MKRIFEEYDEYLTARIRLVRDMEIIEEIDARIAAITGAHYEDDAVEDALESLSEWISGEG